MHSLLILQREGTSSVLFADWHTWRAVHAEAPLSSCSCRFGVQGWDCFDAVVDVTKAFPSSNQT